MHVAAGGRKMLGMYGEKGAWKSSPYDGESRRQILSMEVEDALKLLVMVPHDHMNGETRGGAGVDG